MNDYIPHWLDAHGHDPNPQAPPGNGAFLFTAGNVQQRIDLNFLQALKFTEIAGCHIISTGHGRSGAFRFGGVLVAEFLASLLSTSAQIVEADFEGADSYGTRLDAAMLHASHGPLLAYTLDGAPMQRAQGLVRLIVPGEEDDALRQVKWLATVVVRLAAPD